MMPVVTKQAKADQDFLVGLITMIIMVIKLVIVREDFCPEKIIMMIEEESRDTVIEGSLEAGTITIANYGR